MKYKVYLRISFATLPSSSDIPGGCLVLSAYFVIRSGTGHPPASTSRLFAFRRGRGWAERGGDACVARVLFPGPTRPAPQGDASDVVCFDHPAPGRRKRPHPSSTPLPPLQDSLAPVPFPKKLLVKAPTRGIATDFSTLPICAQRQESCRRWAGMLLPTGARMGTARQERPRA